MRKKIRRRNNKRDIVIAVCLAAVVLLVGKGCIDDRQQAIRTANTEPAEKATQIEAEAHAQAKRPQRKDPLLTLANADHPVPTDWNVDLVELRDGQSVDRRAYKGLQKMLDDARAQGLDPLICSSYRTNQFQTKLFSDQVNAYRAQGYSKETAKKKTALWIAVPGTSEHQLGFAVDIVSVGNQKLDRSQEKTALQKWLIKNCWKYGYILRYPTNKSKITKIGYEPWHYRYVGKQNAKAISEQGVCLEEYLK